MRALSATPSLDRWAATAGTDHQRAQASDRPFIDGDDGDAANAQGRWLGLWQDHAPILVAACPADHFSPYRSAVERISRARGTDGPNPGSNAEVRPVPVCQPRECQIGAASEPRAPGLRLRFARLA
jgi:hypothetical protein